MQESAKREFTYLDFITLPKIDGEEIDPKTCFIPGNIENFRKILGYNTSDGRHIKPNLIYRSGTISYVEDKELSVLSDLKIKLVCDLRATDEIAKSPDRVPEGVIYSNILVDADKGIVDVKGLADFFNSGDMSSRIKAKYLENLSVGAKGYGDFIACFANEENLPILCHCTHGKDRTGIAIAILLDILGVSRDTIYAEYSLSNYCGEELFKQFITTDAAGQDIELSEETKRIMMASNAESLMAIFEYMDSFGGTERFLSEHGGLSPRIFKEIRDNLLE